MAIKFKDPDEMYKFGVTHFDNANHRFSAGVAAKYSFRGVPLTEDYREVPILSRWVPKEEAEQLEQSFKKVIPKTIWTTKKYNGITECRYLTRAEADSIANKLRAKYPLNKYGGQYKGDPDRIKFYFYRFEKKVKYDNE